MGQPFLTQVALDEFLDLAAAFADQGNDVDVRLGVFGHHAEEHALAHSGTGHDAHALADAAGEQSR
jgi:hypothetical protein